MSVVPEDALGNEEPTIDRPPPTSRFGDALDKAPFPCVRLDKRGAVTSANPAASELLGLRLHRRSTTVFSAYVASGHTSAFFLFLRRLLRSETTQRCVLPLRAADGTELTVQLDGRHEGGAEGTALLSLTDVSARESASTRLRASEERMRTLLEALPDAVFVIRDGNVVDCNPAALSIANRHPLGRPFASLIVPQQRPLLEDRGRAATANSLERLELRFLGPDDEELITETLWLPIDFQGDASLLCVARDRTSQRALEAKVANNDRLTTAGVLAAGVAHELNNPLTFVTMNVSEIAAALTEPSFDPSTRKDLQQTAADALDGARRMARIVADMQGLTRLERTLGPVDANAVVDRSLTLCQAQIRPHVEVVTNLGLVPPAFGDEGRLTQIVLNLVLNAAQAIPDSGGRIDVTTSATADGISLVVRDSGPGIPDHIADRVFEPFVTTKPVGQGTGLGLFVCHTYVAECGGSIQAQNSPEGGAMLTVWLQAAEPNASETRTDGPSRTVSGRPRRLLIVDDEQLIRDVLARRLASLGDIETCSSAEEAVARLSAGKDYDLILCDLMMPGHGGRWLHDSIRSEFPQMLPRLCVMTGGAVDPSDVMFLRDTAPPLLRKPFTGAEALSFARGHLAALELEQAER